MDSFNQAIEHLHHLRVKGEGVKIGHLDTGVDGTHPTFEGRIAEFRKFGYCGINEESIPAFDSGWHGTHTAGLLVGESVEGKWFGIAPASKLYSGMVIEEGNVLSRILAGLDWLIDCRVHVVSLAVGISTYTPVFHTIIQAMTYRNIIVICPIGNRGAGQAATPGVYPETLTVGAADASGRVAKFSGSYHRNNTSECHKPNLIAPGTDILSAIPGGKLAVKTGTSMAAAQVAGLAALLWSAYPKVSASYVKTSLIESCTPLSLDQNHRSVAGIVRPIEAFELLKCWSEESATYQDISTCNLQEVYFHDEHSKYVDPRLKIQLEMKDPTALCEVILQLKDWKEVHKLRYLFNSYYDFKKKKGHLKILRNIPAVICRIPQELLEQVLCSPSTVLASACDIDRLL